ncbi:MAG: hypothetical protein GC164_01995 [Phycisphaera sp.]|nr:hypothetical protein [Phycisphaera sp.]
MNPMNLSSSMTVANEKNLAATIRGAQHRVVFVSPAFGDEVAAALADRWRALGPDAVNVVIDIDPEVFRLGYGLLASVQWLELTATEIGAMINKQPGVRIGVLIADDEAWVFAPTPQLIEAGERKPNAPNAVKLGMPPADLERDLGAGPEGTRERSIGLDKADNAAIKKVAEDLKLNPPQRFDVARLLRVFNAFFEFVEFHVSQTQLTRKIVPLKPEVFGITDEVNKARLRASYRLIDHDDELSGSHLMEDRNRIATRFLRVIPGHGMAIKRTEKEAFEAEVKKLRHSVRKYAEMVLNKLDSAIGSNRDALVESLLDNLMQNIPENWNKSALVDTRDRESVREYLTRLIDESFGSAHKLVRGMDVTVNYKAVTYESLTDKNFMKLAGKAFPEMKSLYEEKLTTPVKDEESNTRFDPQPKEAA